MTPWLSLLIVLPILGGLVLLVVPDRSPAFRRSWALAVSLLALILNLVALAHFRDGTSAMQFVENAPWIPALHARYHLGVDGISFPFILLTTLSTVLVVLAGWRVVERHQAAYFAAFLIMEGLMIGVFAALDALLFYLFWEAMLIPMFLIIGIWGGPRRIYATIKFFLYTFLGSVLMLLAILDLAHKTGTFDILAFQRAPLGWGTQIFVFLAFLAAFAVKVPMWPVHTWLPDAHVEAPTGGSVILAAILLKMGAYGFLRFSIPIAPDASRLFAFPMIVLSLVAIVYIAFVALVQDDMKKLVAYSSIAHMGFVTLGFFILFFLFLHPDVAHMGVEGGIFQMISHGFVSGALFLCVGVLYDRMHSREIARYGGVARVMPWFAFFFVLFAMANVALPGTSGFVGEFQVVLASWQASHWWGLLAATSLVTGAAYTLWMIRRVVFNPVVHEDVAKLHDLTPREFLILVPLAILVLLFGLWPEPILHMMHASVVHLVAQAMRRKVSA